MALKSIDEIVESAVKELPGLTKRQLEVLLLITKGMTNKQIAGQLSLKEKTVESYVTEISEQLGVHGRSLSRVAVLYRIAQNGTYEPPLTINSLDFTPRQAEVLSLVGRGLTNHEIAEHMFLKEGTVEYYVNTLIKKALPAETSSSLRSFWAYAARYASSQP